MKQVCQILTDVIEYDDVTAEYVDEIKNTLAHRNVRRFLENDAYNFTYAGGSTVIITIMVSGPGRLQPVRCAIEEAIRRVDERNKATAA